MGYFKGSNYYAGKLHSKENNAVLTSIGYGEGHTSELSEPIY